MARGARGICPELQHAARDMDRTLDLAARLELGRIANVEDDHVLPVRHLANPGGIELRHDRIGGSDHFFDARHRFPSDR